MRKTFLLFSSLMLVLLASPHAEAKKASGKQATAKIGRAIYDQPKLAEHQEIRERFRTQKVLERFQRFFSVMRSPRPLSFRLTDCEGEIEAWYDPDTRIITVCYEYIADIYRSAPKQTTEDGVTREDVVVGSVIEVFLHEAGHAYFDIFNIPILGREEDAADQLAAYVLLQFGDDIALRTVRGVAYMYASEARSTTPSLKAFANEHSLPAQRFFNLACIAYGAKPKVFSIVIEKEYLPRERAERCEEEYKQVAFALTRLLGPHMDKKAAARLQANLKGWTPTTTRRR